MNVVNGPVYDNGAVSTQNFILIYLSSTCATKGPEGETHTRLANGVGYAISIFVWNSKRQTVY